MVQGAMVADRRVIKVWPWDWPPRKGRWLVAVAVAYALAQVVFVSPHLLLGWDETVYLSQVSPHVPTEYFSPPRFRGISYLVAPVAVFTHSVVIIRLYMTAFSAIGLVVAFWPWLTLVGRRAAALAALLVAGLWVVQFYGTQVMPNVADALCAVAAAGWFLLLVRQEGRGRALIAGIAVSMGVLTLLRMGDGLLFGAALGGCALVIRRRRIAVIAAVGAGLAAGVIPWLIEAYVRFGGPMERLRLSSRTEGGMGLHLKALWWEFRSVNGPILCRPCSGAKSAKWAYPAFTWWWLLLPVLVAGGIVVARRTGRLREALVAVAGAAAISVPYLLLLPYAAPRFLIPVYALLVLPAAVLLEAGLTRRRPLPAAVITVLIVAQLAAQNVVLRHTVADQTSSRKGMRILARHLNKIGLNAPCVVAGKATPILGYYSGCASSATSSDNFTATAARVQQIAATTCAMAYIVQGTPPPAFLAGWQRSVFYFRGGGRPWEIYRPPCPQS
jgi:hypothetical protein